MNPWHTCHMRGRACVMTVTRLMASILLHLPVRHQHPETRAPSDGLHCAATGGPRWVQEGDGWDARGLGG